MELTIKDKTKPGYNPDEAIQQAIPKITKGTIDFMLECGVPKHGVIVDIGPTSYKSDRMREHWRVHQANASDFNFDIPTLDGIEVWNAKTITCFEIIEHLQNPLTLIGHMRDMLHPDGSIFISTPGRPRMFWPRFHYFELDPDHFEKWLIVPSGLKIVRKKKLWMDHPWWFYFTGIRPFLRLWYGHSWIYEIKKIN